MAVYLIRCGEDGPVKIGFAADPEERLRDLQCAHHETLHLIRTWDGNRTEEAKLHRHFSRLRIRNEWFRFDEAMLSIEIGAEDLESQKRPRKYDAGLEKALKAAGGPIALARRIGVVPSCITNWHTIPVRRVPEVSLATGIPRHELRPDFWSPASEAA